jgi:hypothetical protein
MADAKHECGNPSSECHLDANVASQEKGAEPGYACRRAGPQSFTHAVAGCVAGARVVGAVLCAGCVPECPT